MITKPIESTLPSLPPNMRRVEVPPTVAAKLAVKFSALVAAQKDFSTACDVALTFAGETRDSIVVGVENGPDAFAVVLQSDM